MYEGKTALVTGSISGIGLGIAEAFAAAGANIMRNGFGDSDAIEEFGKIDPAAPRPGTHAVCPLDPAPGAPPTDQLV